MCHLFGDVCGQRSFLIIMLAKLFAGPGILCTRTTRLFLMVVRKLFLDQSTTLPPTPKVFTRLQKIILLLRCAWPVELCSIFFIEVQSPNYRTFSTSFSFVYSFIRSYIHSD